MAKFLTDAVLDKPADDLIANGNQLCLCAGQPATYAEATTAYPTGKLLASAALDSGDYTKAANDTTGRKVTVGAQTGTVSTTGTCDHAVIVDTVNSALKAGTTITSQALTQGNDWNLGAWAVRFPAPT